MQYSKLYISAIIQIANTINISQLLSVVAITLICNPTLNHYT